MSSWISALKSLNEGNPNAWIVPRKGTNNYDTVKGLMEKKTSPRSAPAPPAPESKKSKVGLVPSLAKKLKVGDKVVIFRSDKVAYDKKEVATITQINEPHTQFEVKLSNGVLHDVKLKIVNGEVRYTAYHKGDKIMLGDVGFYGAKYPLGEPPIFVSKEEQDSINDSV
jgi:hypothetical protein